MLAQCSFPPESEFRRTLSRHLEAIRMKDLRLYRSTISPDDDICVMVQSGAPLRGQHAILAQVQRAFNDRTRQSAASVLSIIEAKDVAMAVIRVDIRDRDAHDRPRKRHYKEVLVFNNRANGWRLVFDYPIEM